MNGERQGLTAVFLLLGIAFLVQAVQIGAVARMVPLAIAVPTCLVLLWELLSGVSRRTEAPRPQAGGADDDRRRVSRRELAMVTWLVGFTAAIHLTGFAVAVFAFCLLYLRFEARMKWRGAVLIAGTAAAIIRFGVEATGLIG